MLSLAYINLHKLIYSRVNHRPPPIINFGDFSNPNSYSNPHLLIFYSFEDVNL